MQTLLTILIVSGAVAYVAWQWMPVAWREAVRSVFLRRKAATPLAMKSTTCGACSTCGACAGGR
ncbi:MAG: hypothetical protein KF797_07140 [Flavobacteriales bacterium]|nr:hypothetical protein [Flavobacteriales bacterium]